MPLTTGKNNFIEEIDLCEVTTLSVAKSAQKRHNAHSIDENEQLPPIVDKFHKEAQDYYAAIHLGGSAKPVLRDATDKEKAWKEKLDRNQHLLEDM